MADFKVYDFDRLATMHIQLFPLRISHLRNGRVSNTKVKGMDIKGFGITSVSIDCHVMFTVMLFYDKRYYFVSYIIAHSATYLTC